MQKGKKRKKGKPEIARRKNLGGGRENDVEDEDDDSEYDKK